MLLFQNALHDMIDDITHLPNGYIFWLSLSVKQQQALKRRWFRSLRECVFPAAFRKCVLQTLFYPETFVVKSDCKELYTWLVKWVYRGREAQLYIDYAKLTTSCVDSIANDTTDITKL